MVNKYNPVNLSWYLVEESSNATRSSDKEESLDLSHMPPLEGDEEVKEGKRLKILTPRNY